MPGVLNHPGGVQRLPAHPVNDMSLSYAGGRRWSRLCCAAQTRRGGDPYQSQEQLAEPSSSKDAAGTLGRLTFCSSVPRRADPAGGAPCRGKNLGRGNWGRGPYSSAVGFASYAGKPTALHMRSRSRSWNTWTSQWSASGVRFPSWTRAVVSRSIPRGPGCGAAAVGRRCSPSGAQGPGRLEWSHRRAWRGTHRVPGMPLIFTATSFQRMGFQAGLGPRTGRSRRGAPACTIGGRPVL